MLDEAAAIDRLERALGARPASLARLGGGCVGDVRAFTMPDRTRAVAKFAATGAATLDIEAFMLRWLAERTALPVPGIIHAEPDLLVMEFVEGSSEGFTAAAERDAAERLAALHAITPSPGGKRFGFERDTLLGALHQPNKPCDSWLFFFREQRLLFTAEAAEREGRLPPRLLRRTLDFAGRLGDFLEEPPAPSLVHGDVWAGNVLARGGRIAAFIDPAIYAGHAEVELAFIRLFSTFGEAFFRRYAELRAIAPGFDDGLRPRRDIYNLYPLLVHARLFDSDGGGVYGQRAGAILARMGF